MVLAHQDEASLARVVFDTVAAGLDADVCINYRFDSTEGRLLLVAGIGIPEPLLRDAQQRELGRGFCGVVAATCAPIVADAARIADDEQGAFVRGMGVRAYACHPLLDRSGRLLGTFSLASTRRDSFDAGDVEVLQALSHVLSLAWERMRADEQRRHGDGPRASHATAARDSTERRSTDNAGVAQETFLDAVFNVVVDGIVTIDERGSITTVNASTERIFGYQAQELIGRNVNVLMPAPYHDEHDGYLEHYQRTGHARIIGIGREVSGRRKDGSVFPVELSVAEFTIDGTRFFVGVVRDITDRKLAEERLRQSELQFREMANNVPVII
ncbi:MAG: PAS domain S-box protein [Vicinamibacterales bacterium]